MGAMPTCVALFYLRPLFYLSVSFCVEIWHNTKTNTFRLLLRKKKTMTFAGPPGVGTTSFQSEPHKINDVTKVILYGVNKPVSQGAGSAKIITAHAL